jgi:hypothetical protein
MKPTEFWKNFNLGEEVSISGTFIYNGLRRFHELKKLDYTDEIFEVFYFLSVGLERLLKIAVVLLEHNDTVNQKALEQSLITHIHLDLLHRIKQHTTVNLSTPHNEFLGLLATFYKTFRYDRFSLTSVFDFKKERNALCGFLGKYLQVAFQDPTPLWGTPNEARYRRFIRKTVLKISTVLYKIVETRASELNLYTYQLRDGSKAQTVFLGEADIPAEDVLWKELLVFFMNTKSTSGYLEFLRSIPPLDFDPELVDEYLDCFQSDAAKAFVIDELKTHYGEMTDKGDRLKKMEVIGSPNVSFDALDAEEDFEATILLPEEY